MKVQGSAKVFVLNFMTHRFIIHKDGKGWERGRFWVRTGIEGY